MEAAGVSPADIDMGLTEILLFTLGIIVVVGSFIIPGENDKKESLDIKKQEERIKELVQSEVKQAAFHIEEKIEEVMVATTEKTERYMERLSNEKIMAIQEYSDTVLHQINKNHEEAVFLYDMLNNKHIQIKNTAAEINNRVQDVKTNEEYKTNEKKTEQQKEEKKVMNNTVEGSRLDKNAVTKENKKVKGRTQNKKNQYKKNEENKNNNTHKMASSEISLEQDFEAGTNKSKILKLHEEGKTNVEIAKSLGLGIGEVKLIIDLFENGE